MTCRSDADSELLRLCDALLGDYGTSPHDPVIFEMLRLVSAARESVRLRESCESAWHAVAEQHRLAEEARADVARLREALGRVFEHLGLEGSGLDMQTACDRWDGHSSCRSRAESPDRWCDGCIARDQIVVVEGWIQVALAATDPEHR